jgi:diketogulonate reductase-like aldo/keto reductase
MKAARTKMTGNVPVVQFGDGNAMPQLGFGAFDVPIPKLRIAMETALEAGYRSFDTAANYGTEAGVGEAIARSGLPRREIFLTTKLWNPEQGYESTLAAFNHSLRQLKQDYVDLYLIHWPRPKVGLYLDTWRAFERLQDEGRVRSIGVSNFLEEHLRNLFAHSSRRPVVNQIELHPELQQEALRAFDRDHGIVTEAWSPLAVGKLLQHPVLVDIARRHGKTTAQVVLRWHIEIGNVVIPKSATPARIVENIDVFDFALSADDMARIAQMNRGARVGMDPRDVN